MQLLGLLRYSISLTVTSITSSFSLEIAYGIFLTEHSKIFGIYYIFVHSLMLPNFNLLHRFRESRQRKNSWSWLCSTHEFVGPHPVPSRSFSAVAELPVLS